MKPLFSIRALWCLAVVASAVGITAGSWSYAKASAAERLQSRRLVAVTQQTELIAEVSSSLPEWATATKAAGTLAPEVSGVLAAAGLPPAAMASLSAEGDAQPRNSANGAGPVQVRTRRATLVLASVTLPQVGAFLDRWKARQPAWTVSGIELAPEPGGAQAKASTGGDLPLRVVLTLETLSIEQAGGVR